MKHDRRRACLSHKPYVWDKYEVVWGLTEEKDVLIRRPGFEAGGWHIVCAESYTFANDVITLVNPFIAEGDADLTNLYWVLREGRVPMVPQPDGSWGPNINPVVGLLYKGNYVVDKTVFATLTGYDGEVLTIGYGVTYWKVPFCYIKGSGSVPGVKVGEVTGHSFGAFPKNGIKDGYWYIRR